MFISFHKIMHNYKMLMTFGVCPSATEPLLTARRDHKATHLRTCCRIHSARLVEQLTRPECLKTGRPTTNDAFGLSKKALVHGMLMTP